jgi:hypothetical protein
MNNINDLSDLALKFLTENYVFRQLEIYDLFDNDRIFWTHKKSRYYRPEIDSYDEPCILLDEHKFHDWADFDKKHVKYFSDEFQIYNLRHNIKFKVTDIKRVINDLIVSKQVVKKISFNPVLKECVKEGRTKITRLKPLHSSSEKREPIKANVGEKLYICKSSKPPYISSPCYIIKAADFGSYRVMFFTNLDKELSETTKIDINGWGFTTAYANELGRTPSEAVLQNQN